MGNPLPPRQFGSRWYPGGDNYAPLIVFEGSILSPYVMCLPVIFPFTPVNVDTQDWFQLVFCNCFLMRRAEHTIVLKQHVESLLTAIEADCARERYIRNCSVAFSQIQDRGQCIQAVLKDLRTVIQLANVAGEYCVWYGRENVEQLGPSFLPWPLVCVAI